MKNKILHVFVAMLMITLALPACTGKQGENAPAASSDSTASTGTGGEDLTAMRLRRFDTLDFQFYNNQKWDSFAVSHDPNIKVHYPDGTTTTGLFPQHIDLLKPMFVFAPDTKITAHPVSFGSGDWTTVIGEMEGTFSKPMDIGNGKTIPPTGKKFKLSMCTVSHWKDGKMTEEYLFWDNQFLMKQIGVAQ